MNKESESESEILCILIEVLSRARAKRRKSLQDFKSGILIGRFSSDGASSITMKGFNSTLPKAVGIENIAICGE